MIIEYRMELDAERHPVLVKEKEYFCGNENFNSARKLVDLFNNIFRLRYLTEENVVMIAFDIKMHPLGVFHISKGTVSCAMCSPREIFIRALSIGAENVIICHNHPSGDPVPSKDDIKMARRIYKSGELLNIRLSDFIIMGKSKYYSALEDGVFDSEHDIIYEE